MGVVRKGQTAPREGQFNRRSRTAKGELKKKGPRASILGPGEGDQKGFLIAWDLYFLFWDPYTHSRYALYLNLWDFNRIAFVTMNR